MIELIDTHSHLYLPQFSDDRDEVVGRAAKAGVSAILLPNINNGSLPQMRDVVNRYKGICMPMLGLHPTSVNERFEEEFEEIFKQRDNIPIVAIGETGIDLYWDKTHIDKQKESFKRHIEISLDMDLPLVVHARDSFEEIFAVLDHYKGSRLRGVFHAFSGGPHELERVLGAGFMVGAGGMITFKNSDVASTIGRASLAEIVLETDSPYLAPDPYRGKRNESSWLTVINRRLAEIFGVDEETSAKETSANAKALFGMEIVPCKAEKSNHEQNGEGGR